MSLTACLDDVLVDALALDGSDAQCIQRRSREKRLALVHPACGKPVQLRAGAARSWHFAHLPGVCADGEHEHEGWQHRSIKREVLIASRSLGWRARGASPRRWPLDRGCLARG